MLIRIYVLKINNKCYGNKVQRNQVWQYVEQTSVGIPIIRYYQCVQIRSKVVKRLHKENYM